MLYFVILLSLLSAGLIIILFFLNKSHKQKEITWAGQSSSLKTKQEQLFKELESQKQNYEDKRAEDKTHFDKELSLQKQNYEEKIKEKEKQWSIELKSQKSLYEEKIREKAEGFQKEKEIEKKLYEEKENHYKKLAEKTEEKFKSISQNLLQSNTEQYQKTAKESLNQLLNPLKDKITGFEKTMRDCYETEGQQRFSLKTEIEKITKANQNLTQALKGDVRAQGDWGEMILKRVLESSGLEEGKAFHFSSQGKGLGLKNEEGNPLKPDVIIQLPDERQIVIDSKVSLTHYHNYISAKTEEEKNKTVKQIVSSLSQHIDSLSDKYHQIKDLNTPDFVLMFIPLEGALSLSLKTEQELFERAWKKNIAIVSPITLYSTLKIINTLWKIEAQNKNAKKIAIAGGRLYDKFKGFVEDMLDMGKGLDNAQKNYDSAFKKLKTGRGNLIGTAEKIKKLGANTDKSLPPEATSE